MGPIATNASLQLIYNQLRSVGRYHPFTAETFADWATEAGDIVEVSRDGVGYASPLHATTLRWNGKQQMEMEANGQKERDSVARMSARAFNSGAGGGAGYRSSARAKREVMNEIADEEARTSTRFTQTGNMLSMAVGTTSVTGKDIIAYDNREGFPSSGNPDKVYKANDTGAYYIWRGGQYIRVTLDTDGNNAYWVKAGDIAIAINEDGSTTGRINADRVYLGRMSKDLLEWAGDTDGVLADKITARDVRTMTLTADEITTFLANIGDAEIGSIDADDVTSRGDISAQGDAVIQGDVVGSAFKLFTEGDTETALNVVDVTVSNGQLIITHVNGQSETFSKATSLEPEWSGGVLTLSGSPAQNPALEYKVGFGNGTADMHLGVELGDGVATNFKKILSIPVKINELSDSYAGGKREVYSGSNITVNATPVYNNGWGDARAVVEAGLPRSNTSNGNFSVDVPARGIGSTETLQFTLQTGTVPGPNGHASVIMGNVSSEDAVIVGQVDIGRWYTKGKNDAGVTLDEPAWNAITGSAENYTSRTLSFKAYNSSNPSKKAEDFIDLELVQGTKCVYLKANGVTLAKQTCTPETVTVIEYSGSFKDGWNAARAMVDTGNGVVYGPGEYVSDYPGQEAMYEVSAHAYMNNWSGTGKAKLYKNTRTPGGWSGWAQVAGYDTSSDAVSIGGGSYVYFAARGGYIDWAVRPDIGSVSVTFKRLV